MSSGNYEELVLRRARDIRLKAAINDNPYEAGIMSAENPDGLIGSRWFNVATAAMRALRLQPGKQLLTHPIELSKRDKENDLLRYTMNILNVGHVALRSQGSFTSPAGKSAGTCGQSEPLFWNAAHQEQLEADQQPPSLLVNQEGGVVFFEKELGQPTALSMKAVHVNGVKYPGGTLFAFQSNLKAPRVRVGNFDVMRAENASIDYVAPLRYSAFTFKKEDREAVFTPSDPMYELPGQGVLIAHTPTYSELINSLPDVLTLRGAYKACKS